jgi:hypothetical protein
MTKKGLETIQMAINKRIGKALEEGKSRNNFSSKLLEKPRG